MTAFEKIGTALVAGLVAIALASTLVGKGKETPQVIDATGGLISQSLSAAQGK